MTGPALAADAHHLRSLIANERLDRLELLAQVVIGLGHDVIAREIYVREVGPATARAGEALTHRLVRLPDISKRSGRLLGPLQGLVVDG